MSTTWKTSSRFVGWLLAVSASIGLVASFTLLYETFEVAKNPAYEPACNLSIFLSCESAMTSESSALFLGLPNPAIGVAAFTALFVFAVLLLSGAVFKPWVWLAGIGAATFGIGLSLFFYFESLFSMGTICPWCSVTWLVVVAAFWGVITHALAAKRIAIPKQLKGVAAFWVQYAGVILASMYVALIFGILLRFNEVLFV